VFLVFVCSSKKTILVTLSSFFAASDTFLPRLYKRMVLGSNEFEVYKSLIQSRDKRHR
jgi:hypothetical protein